MTQQSIELIREAFLKPAKTFSVPRMVDALNEILADTKNFRPLSRGMCGCNIRPYVIKAVKHLDELEKQKKEDTTVQPLKKNTGKKTNNKKSVNVSPGT